MGARVVTVNEVLGGHVQLDIECLDRVYLNAYVPILQSSGQVVAFMTQHLGLPIPSPAIFDKIGQKFRRAVATFAEANGIPWVRFAKDDRKADVMAPYFKRAAATGRPQVAAIGVAQEFQRVQAACRRETSTAAPQFTFAKADRRVTCYYFYLWDADFGPAFIKVCSYFPYPAKIWVNGHEWAKRQAAQAGIAFTELSNGFASCEDPGALQEICDRLQPGTIEVFTQRWLHRLPLPFGPADQRAGYWQEISMRQVEVSRTLVLDAPRRARAFFEALIADNLDIGRPANVEIIFRRHIRRDTPACSAPPSTALRSARTPAGSSSTCFTSIRGSSSTSRTAGRCGSRLSSTPPPTSAATPGCPIWPNSRTGRVPATAAYWKLNVPARAPSSRAQPLSGSRTPPLMRTGGGPRLSDSAILGSWPWPAPSAPPCSPRPASPTRACAP
jgi:hypothetical protein